MERNTEYTSKAHNFLRPEVFCAELLANGFSFNNLRLVSGSSFKKGFRNEIDEVNFNDEEDTKMPELELVINRDGIYDRLPEGLFHQSRGNSKTSTTAEMAEEHRRFKDEERMARKFFQPIEQEFFRYSSMVEQEELNLAFGILNGDLKSELSGFWDIPDGLPEEAVKRLIQVMPWAKLIKGDIEQTAKALELILGKPVQASQEFSQLHKTKESVFCLGTGQLGVNTVAGGFFWEPSDCWRFCIEDLKKHEIETYTPSRPYGKLLKQFEEIFIPLQIDIIFEYLVLPAEDFETEDVLGYSLSI